MKKFSIFALTMLIFTFLPRITNVSAAADCFWVMEGNQYTCRQFNQNQATPYYTQYSNTSQANTWGQIWQQSPLSRIGNQCLFTATIAWQSSGAHNVQVTVMDPNTGQEKLFTNATSGQAPASWITPYQSYRFTLWNTDNGQKNALSQITVTGYGLNCGVPDSGQYAPSPPYNSANAGNITMRSNQAYCVGQTPTYAVSAPGMGNQTAQWTSWHDGLQMSQLPITLDRSGNFSGSGNQWAGSDIGHWKKTVAMNTLSQSMEFDVRNCGAANAAPSSYTGYAPSVSGTASNQISIMDNSFSPATIMLSAGTTVRWIQNGNMRHTVTADNGIFDSGTLMPGQSYSITLSQPGTYRYYCQFHGGPGGQGMSGQIVVAGSRPPPAASPAYNSSWTHAPYPSYTNNSWDNGANTTSSYSTSGSTWDYPVATWLQPLNNSNAQPQNTNTPTYTNSGSSWDYPVATWLQH